MDAGIRIEGRWAVDAPPSVTLALVRRLDIADRLGGEHWRLTRDADGSMIGHLRRGPIRIALEREEQVNYAHTLHYRMTAKRFGVTVRASAEVECQPGQGAGSIVGARLRLDDSLLLRFLPRRIVDQRLFSLQYALLISLEQALEALSADWEAALSKLNEGDRQLLLPLVSARWSWPASE